MKQIPALISCASASGNNGNTQRVDNAGQQDIGVLRDTGSTELNNNFVVSFGVCDSLIPQLVPGQGSLSAHGSSVTAMSDQPSSGRNDSYDRQIVQISSSDFGGGSKEGMSQTNSGSMMPSGSCPVEASDRLITDKLQSSSVHDERRTQPVSSGSHSADAITVLSPSIEKSLHDRSLVHGQHQSKHSAPWRVRGIPGVSSSGDLSRLLTLEEDKELNISPTARSEIVAQPPPPNRMSPGMLGRRHSMDSNIGRSRPPTFVRTYRDVKWKRVSKPSKLRQLPRTPSLENVIAASSGAGGEAESREYITGTHIIRQRVPIFMTSRDPPGPMGRRFSAGDLIPVTGQGRNWAPTGKCLVIRDMVSNKLVHTSSSEDSSSSSSSPSSSTEDVRVSQSGDSSEDRDDHYQFSLIDEDEEEDDDLTGGSDDDDENKKDSKDKSMASPSTSEPTLVAPTTNSSTASVSDSSASAQKIKTPKDLDLRRLVLENSLPKKDTVQQPDTASNRDILPQSAPSTSSPHMPFPALHQLASSSASQAGMVSALTEHPLVPIMSSVKEPTGVPSVTLSVVIPFTTQPAMDYVNAQSVPRTQTIAMSSTDRQTSTSTTTQSAMETVSILNSMPSDNSQLIPTTSHAKLDTNLTNQAGHLSPTYLPPTGELNINLTPPHEPSNSHLCPPKEAIVSRPSSPSEMPWVMTSTKIADANVYVSSSHTPNSNMSTRSAHWISPRSVEGTIPINLENAKAIRVETVDVPTSPESKPLRFQKVTYSSGFIISSAQWVAPTEVLTEPPSSNEVRTLPSEELTVKQLDLAKPASSPHQRTPGSGQSTPIKKSRRKYVVERTGIIKRPVLFNSDLLPGVSRESPANRPIHSQQEVTCQEGHLNEEKPDSNIPSLLDLPKTGASHRQSKRRFDLDTKEADLCAQRMLSSLSLSSSPTISKRRFVVEKVPDDLVGASLSNLNGLSAKLDMTFCPTQSTLGCGVNEVDDNPMQNTGREVESDFRQSLSSQHESPGVDTSHHESVATVTSRQLQMCHSVDTEQDIPQEIPTSDPSLEDHITSHTDVEPIVSTTCSELATHLRESCTTTDSVESRLNSSRHTKLRTDTEDDERFAKENDALLQMILTSISVTQEADNDSNHSGGSTVAIDNKIEQAMDLVKRHLMYAVREEVEILKQQIGEMMDRIGQLEYENTVLRSEAKPETLSKLLQPRLTQPPQAALPTQPQTASITAAPTQQQPAASQIQPPQQQQTTVSQVGQPPSTT